MDYIYDESGVCGCRMTLNGAVANYFYARNAKGDVVEIYNSSGTCVVKYAYDAYGNCTVVSSSDANILAYNSIKYRGYYYDGVMGLYWLQTRYYDPNTGRFISPDETSYLDTDTVHGVNLYAYCGNCPTMFADPSGHIALLTAILVGAAIGAAVGFWATVFADYMDDGQVFNGSISAEGYLLNTAVGAVFGALIGATGGALGGALPIGAGGSMAFAYAGAGVAGTTAIGVSAEALMVIGAVGTLTWLLSISMYGPPGAPVSDEKSFGEYDENGHLLYRVDTDHAHYIKELGDYYMPHVHNFKWKLVNGVWRFVKKIWSHIL